MSIKVAAMMRVKDEARWITEVLASVKPITDDILILDDHSTDGTPTIAAGAGATVLHSPFPANDKDEARDKNFLLDALRAGMAPDYVLAIDGDEILDAGAARLVGMFNHQRSFYTMRVKYLWNDRQHVRMDGVYARFERASAFSLVRQPATVHFRSTGYGANFHCGNVPVGLVGAAFSTGISLLHLGYMEEDDRARKYAWYNAIDPGNIYEDRYRHIAAGVSVSHQDLVAQQREFWEALPPDQRRPWLPLPPPPLATDKCLHGGPLKLWSIGVANPVT